MTSVHSAACGPGCGTAAVAVRPRIARFCDPKGILSLFARSAIAVLLLAGGARHVVAATPVAVAAEPFVLPASEQWDMQASGSGRPYRIFVAWPDQPPPASGYRVLYVLDGNAMFLTAVEAVRAKSGDRPRGDQATAQEVAREIENALTVVVGIGYPPAPPLPRREPWISVHPA